MLGLVFQFLLDLPKICCVSRSWYLCSGDPGSWHAFWFAHALPPVDVFSKFASRRLLKAEFGRSRDSRAGRRPVRLHSPQLRDEGWLPLPPWPRLEVLLCWLGIPFPPSSRISPNLRVLLVDTGVHPFDCRCVESLPNLRWLGVEAPQLALPGSLSRAPASPALESLKFRLGFERCRNEAEVFGALNRLLGLRYLSVDYTSTDGATLTLSLPQLVELSLVGGPEHTVLDLPNLRYLRCDRGGISGVASLLRLEHVSACCCAASPSGGKPLAQSMRDLSELPNLTRVDLSAWDRRSLLRLIDSLGKSGVVRLSVDHRRSVVDMRTILALDRLEHLRCVDIRHCRLGPASLSARGSPRFRLTVVTAPSDAVAAAPAVPEVDQACAALVEQVGTSCQRLRRMTIAAEADELEPEPCPLAVRWAQVSRVGVQ